MRTRIKKPIAFLLTLAMCLSLLPAGALAADGNTIVAWGSGLVPITDPKTTSMALPIIPTGGSNTADAELTRGGNGAGATVSSTDGGTNAQTIYTGNWTANDSYWQIKFSTSGITGPMHLKAGQFSTTNGPKVFQLKYSTDGTNFTVLGSPYTIGTAKSDKPAVIVDLPAALQDQSVVYIRFYPTDGTAGATNNSRIHDIYVVEGLAPIPTPKPAAAPPGGTQANPKLVRTDAEIEISTVSGATYTRYTWDGNNPERNSAPIANGEKLKLADNTYVTASGVHHLKVSAKEPDKAVSDVLDVYYTTKLAAPTANPAAGSAPEGQKIKLASAGLPVGGKIYYTTDGTAPTASSSLYSDATPITLAFGAGETATVKTVAISEGYDDSSIQSFTYTKGALDLGNIAIADARKKADATEVIVKGIVTRNSGASVYMQDESGGIVVNMYLTGTEGSTAVFSNVKVGDEILVKGKITQFNGLVQVKPALSKTDPDAVQVITPQKGVPAPLVISVAALATGKYEGMYVTVPEVTLSNRTADVTKADNHEISKDGAKLMYRAYLDGTIVKGGIYNVTGWAGKFSPDIQLVQIGGKNAGIASATPDGSTVGDPVEVAGWSYSSQVPVPIDANSGIHKNTAKLNLNAGAITSNAKGFSANGWNNGAGTKYWQASFSTISVSNVTVSSAHASSSGGPRDFKLQYSVDNGATFKEVIGGRIEVPNNKPITDCPLTNIPLPMDADNKEKVIVRWTVNSSVSAGNSTIGDTGTNQINSITIKGRELFGPDSVAPVKAAPVSGAVALNTEIALSSNTADTKIYYTLNGDEPTTSSTSYSGPIKLSVLPAAIKAIAVRNSDPSKVSLPKTFSYTQAKLGAIRSSKPDGSKISVDLDRITFSTVEKGTSIHYILTTQAGARPEQVYSPEIPIVLAAGDFPINFKVWASKADYINGDPIEFNYVLNQGGTPKNYFGQLHSHTAENSDGAGTLDEAFAYAANQSGVDFLAVTDHSNAFDTASKDDGPDKYNLTTYNADNVKWNNGLNAANTYTSNKFVGMYGYEMTWSGGPGHINTFNTTGFVSRNNAILNTKTEDKGMRAYYELLSRSDSANTISQFNHPGTTFGNFANFGYWNPVIDTRITLVEVGNGEGAIGSGGYFPSYSEYTLALDKGWHVGPTNNQDNHQKKWGDANNARTVLYTNDFSREGLYQAMRDRRVYATEDKNLDIVYTLNGNPLGTIVPTVPSSAQFKAIINDPDSTDKISKVEIISMGGQVVYSFSPDAQNYTLDYTITKPAPGYYYVRVRQADLDIAVTAPIWLGAAKAVGMSELTTTSYMPVMNEAVELKTNFFNNEDETAIIKKVTYSIKNGAQIIEQTSSARVQPFSTMEHTYKYIPTSPGVQIVVITAQVDVGGEIKTYTSELTLDVKNPADLVYVGIDGSHYNEYVAGNYKDSMGNFAKLAGGHSVRVNVLKTSAELLEALKNPKYKMFVFTAPSRRLEVPGAIYPNYSEEEVNAVAAFAKAGGIVVVAGWGDYYESYAYSPKAQVDHMAAQQNRLLKAAGSSLRLADDEAKDNDNNPGNNAARLYLTDYNGFKSPLLAGVNPMQVWSQYGGSTVFAVGADNKPVDTLPSGVTPVISGYGAINSDGSGKKLDKIDSYDDDKDGYGLEVEAGQKPPKYTSDSGKRVLLTATETVKHGGKESLVIATGGAFMSNFEIKADVENATSLNYSNYNFLENLIERVNPPKISTIKEAQEGSGGRTFTIEGVVTSSVWNGSDNNTGFFDCIYVQDETGGINAFPVSSGVVPGQRVRVTGVRSAYEGERQLQGVKVKVLSYSPAPLPAPKLVHTWDVKRTAYMGSLVKVVGWVRAINMSNGVVQSIQLEDDSDERCTVYIDGYITKGKEIEGLEVGKVFAAIGISSYNENNGQARIRVRDRADVYATSEPPTPFDDETAEDTRPTSLPPDSIKESGSAVEVTLPSSNTKLDNVSNEKLISANKAKPIELSGGGLKVVIPVGMLSSGSDVSNLLVNPKKSGNVIRVTKSDSTTAILPIAIVGGGEAAYVANITGTYEVVDNTKSFPDTTSHWAANAIGFAASRELFKGMSDSTFAPNQPMTRGMLVTVLSRIDGGKTATGNIFSDVPANAWYAKEIAWAAQNKLVEGDGRNFNPDASLTREQLCVILTRYLEHSGLALNETRQVGAYADVGSINPWAKAAMEQAIKAGLIDGKSGGLLDPQGKATRAEIATILQRFVEGVLK